LVEVAVAVAGAVAVAVAVLEAGHHLADHQEWVVVEVASLFRVKICGSETFPKNVQKMIYEGTCSLYTLAAVLF
jgi:hypothetical protein